jgi:hypothetical protein
MVPLILMGFLGPLAFTRGGLRRTIWNWTPGGRVSSMVYIIWVNIIAVIMRSLVIPIIGIIVR